MKPLVFCSSSHLHPQTFAQRGIRELSLCVYLWKQVGRHIEQSHRHLVPQRRHLVVRHTSMAQRYGQACAVHLVLPTAGEEHVQPRLFRLAVRKSVLQVHRLLLSSGMGIDGLIRQNIALAPGASSSGGKTVLTRQKHGVRMGARVSI